MVVSTRMEKGAWKKERMTAPASDCYDRNLGFVLDSGGSEEDDDDGEGDDDNGGFVRRRVVGR
jgi:hypothetical protein